MSLDIWGFYYENSKGQVEDENDQVIGHLVTGKNFQGRDGSGREVTFQQVWICTPDGVAHEGYRRVGGMPLAGGTWNIVLYGA